MGYVYGVLVILKALWILSETNILRNLKKKGMPPTILP